MKPRWSSFAVALALVGTVFTSTSLDAAATSKPRTVTSVQYGIDTYFTYTCQPAAEIEQWATTEVEQYKALGANSIGIGFPLYTAAINSDSVFADDSCDGSGYETPPPAILSDVVQIAHAAGLRVLLRPLIDEKNLFAESPKNWRGILHPSNLTLWFKNYLTTLRPYLLMAQSDKVEYFAVETELDSLADYNNWAYLIAISRQVYTGTLAWNYSWDTGVKKLLRPATKFAVDAYPKIQGLGITATVKQLVAKWNFTLRQTRYYAIPRISKATIDEIGIEAQDGAYPEPYQGGLPLATHPFNQQIQVHWFEAACAFMKLHKMQGIYFWGPWLTAFQGAMLTTPDPGQPSNIQPKSQLAIKACFTGT